MQALARLRTVRLHSIVSALGADSHYVAFMQGLMCWIVKGGLQLLSASESNRPGLPLPHHAIVHFAADGIGSLVPFIVTAMKREFAKLTPVSFSGGPKWRQHRHPHYT